MSPHQAGEAVSALLPTWDATRYQLVSTLMPNLSSGGQIELYLDTWSGTEVAAKRFPSDRIRESPEAFRRAYPEAVENPWKELAVTALLGGPAGLACSGACACYGAFRDADGDVLMVLEYLASGDLFSFAGSLGDPGPQREQQVWPVIQSLLRAVSALHALGVAHGDISLENAMRRPGPDGEVVLVDFEAARLGEEVPRASGSRGKPSYQAPEMRVAALYDARDADLFSCGVAAYCLAVGAYPWQSTRPGKCMQFSFFQQHGLQGLLAKKSIRTSQGMRHVGDCMSEELVTLLGMLLHPVPSQRRAAVRHLVKGRDQIQTSLPAVPKVEAGWQSQISETFFGA